jgi:hypothetical protein
VVEEFLSDQSEILHRATLAINGMLSPRFSYLQDYVDGKL